MTITKMFSLSQGMFSYSSHQLEGEWEKEAAIQIAKM